MFEKKLCYNHTTYGYSCNFFCVYSRNEPLHFTFEEKSDEYGDRKFLPRGYICAGTEIGELVKPGTVTSLVGDLGVGKTVFTRDWKWDLELRNR